MKLYPFFIDSIWDISFLCQISSESRKAKYSPLEKFIAQFRALPAPEAFLFLTIFTKIH